MMACERPDCPEWLEQRWEAWGEEYAELRKKPKHEFHWKSYEGQMVNHRLLPLLRTMTEEHCAYCDWFPTDVGTDPTIDHFRPKAQYPKQAYDWRNLYLCCRTCQEKDDKNFSEDLLRPDDPGYRFEDYFVYNNRDGTLAPHPAADVQSRERAALTIRHLKLNKGGRPKARQREVARFRLLSPLVRPEWLSISPFRYLLISELEPLTPC